MIQPITGRVGRLRRHEKQVYRSGFDCRNGRIWPNCHGTAFVATMSIAIKGGVVHRLGGAKWV